MLDSKELFYFITVAKCNSFTKAANTLHLTQPTITRTIQILENKLGYKLFLRKSHNVILTDQGVLFFKRAKEIIELIKLTEDKFKNIDDNLSGNISIGAGETIGFNIIANAIKILQQKHPKVTFSLESDDAEETYHKLNLGLLDFGLVLEPVRENNDFNILKLPYYDTWGLLVDKTHPLANKEYVTKEDLLTTKLMISNQILKNLSESSYFSFLKQSAYKANIIGTYNLIFNAALIAQKSNVAILSIKDLVNTKSPDISFKFLEFKPCIKTNIMLLWKKNRDLLPIQCAFLEILKNSMKK